MTTERFNDLAGATARAMQLAHDQVKFGRVVGSIACPKCGGSIRFSGNLNAPHRTAGSCLSARCVRWAAQ
jgi:hypothetical protein